MSRARSAVADGFTAVKLQQHIRGMRQRPVSLDKILAFADTVVGRNNHGDLGSEPDRFVDVGVVIVLRVLAVVEGERGDRGAQHVHGESVTGCSTQKIKNSRVEMPFLRQLLAKIG